MSSKAHTQQPGRTLRTAPGPLESQCQVTGAWDAGSPEGQEQIQTRS